MQELVSKLRRKCTARGLNLSDDILFDEIEDAIEAVNDRRGFVPSNAILFETKYKSLIVRLALSSISKMGAEGETSHNENGIERQYQSAREYPDDLLNEIIPLVK